MTFRICRKTTFPMEPEARSWSEEREREDDEGKQSRERTEEKRFCWFSLLGACHVVGMRMAITNIKQKRNTILYPPPGAWPLLHSTLSPSVDGKQTVELVFFVVKQMHTIAQWRKRNGPETEKQDKRHLIWLLQATAVQVHRTERQTNGNAWLIIICFVHVLQFCPSEVPPLPQCRVLA